MIRLSLNWPLAPVGKGVPSGTASNSEGVIVKVFRSSRSKELLIAVAGLCIGAGMAAAAMANGSAEPPRLAELRVVLPVADSKTALLPIGSEETVFATDTLRSAVLADARTGDFAYPRRGESCSLAGFVENLVKPGCGTILADCPCDDMGTTHGGGGCVGCFR